MIITQKWAPDNCDCVLELEKDDTIQTIPWKTKRVHRKCKNHQTVPDISLAQILIFESKKAAQIQEKLDEKYPDFFKSVLIDPERPELGLEKIPKDDVKITKEWVGNGTQRKLKVEIGNSGTKIQLPELDRELFDYIRKVKKII